MGRREMSVFERTAMISCGVLCRRDSSPKDFYNNGAYRGVRVLLTREKRRIKIIMAGSKGAMCIKGPIHKNKRWNRNFVSQYTLSTMNYKYELVSKLRLR